MDIRNALTTKIGPLPVWAIIGAVVVGIGYSAYRARNDTPAPEDTADGDNIGEPALNPVLIANPQATSNTVPATIDVVPMDAWRKSAIAALIATGNYTASTATSLVQKYENGDDLSYAERQAIDKMLAKVGLPPELPEKSGGTGIPLGSNAKQAKTLPGTHKVTGSRDDNINDLTTIYYGTINQDARNLLRSRNMRIPVMRDGSGRMPVGTVVYVPKLTTPKYYNATAAVNTKYAIAAKNGISVSYVEAFNPGMKFPVKSGTRVRVG